MVSQEGNAVAFKPNRGFRRIHLYQQPVDFIFSSLQNCVKQIFLLFELPCLQHFIIVSLAGLILGLECKFSWKPLGHSDLIDRVALVKGTFSGGFLIPSPRGSPPFFPHPWNWLSFDTDTKRCFPFGTPRLLGLYY